MLIMYFTGIMTITDRQRVFFMISFEIKQIYIEQLVFRNKSNYNTSLEFELIYSEVLNL